MQDAATSRWCAIPSTGWRWAPIARCTAAVRCADGHHLAQLRRQVAGTSPLTLRRGSSGHQGSTPNSAERHHAANGTLYNAELAKISKVEKVEDNLDNPPKLFVIYDDLPKDEAHGWKFLTIGPDNKLYFNVGAPCNICMPSPAPQLRHINLDGSNPEVVARGVRQVVGMDWHPTLGQLYFTKGGHTRGQAQSRTQPGRDNLGYPCASTDTTAIHFRSSVGASMSERPPRTTGSACTPAAKPLRHADESKSACEKPGYQCRHMRRFCRTEFK